MTYDLVIGDYAYSSWSLRGWLLFEKFEIPHRITLVDFSKEGALADQMPKYAPAKTVPVMRTPDDLVVPDSLAMAEELASRHPDKAYWPKDVTARGVARVLVAEMHSGFVDLRNECPMNLRVSYEDSQPSDAVLADIKRLERLWAWARENCGSDGPWLCGDYGIVDAFYAPVAARIAGYNLPVGSEAAAYVNAHLADPAFQKWRALGLEIGPDLPWYQKDYPKRDWPIV